MCYKDVYSEAMQCKLEPGFAHRFGLYSGPPLIRPPQMQPQSDLIRGVASPEGDNITETSHFQHKNSGLLRGVASGERSLTRGGPLYINTHLPIFTW